MQTTPVSAGTMRTQNGMPGLGKEEFLRLLIAQMRQQDPLQPMNDREFIAQLAQFSTLEQMQNISAGLEELMRRQDAATALGLIGKTVSVTDAEGKTQTGRVSAVRRQDRETMIVVDGKAYPVSSLIEVRS